MGITAISGPNISYGITTGQSTTGLTGVPADYNEQRAPSVSDLGFALMDPRAAYNYSPGESVSQVVGAFYHSRGMVDVVPFAASSQSFVSNTVVSTGVTTFTLNAASTGRATYSATITAPESGLSLTLLAIGSSAEVTGSGPALLPFGSAGTVNLWAPTGVGRCVSITTSSSGDGGTFSIAGRDVYGYKVTETLAITDGTTNSSGYTITSKKAFKYISAISNTSTPVSTGVSIGIADKFGMPLYVPYTGQNCIINLLATSFSSVVAVALSSANFTLGSTVATATSTTPDARGTYTSSTATDGTLRLQITVTPSASAAYAVTSSNVSPFFGITQYSSV